MAEYSSQFEFLVVTVRRLRDATLAAVFVNGLTEKVRAESLVHNSQGLREMMDVASRIEAKQQIHAAHTKPSKELPSTQTRLIYEP